MVGDKIQEIATEIEQNHPTGIIHAKVELTQDVKEKVVSAFEVPTELPKPEKIVLPKAKGIMMGADYLAALPKTTFQNLLIEFNSLVEDLPPIKQVEDKLYELILQAQNSDLTARQSEAIRDRCIYYLKCQYSGQKTKK